MGEYRSAQVTQQAKPAVPLFNAVEDALTAHPSWEKVNVYRYAAAATFKDHLWRNIGTANDWGQDWYLWLTQVTDASGTPTSDPNLYMNVSESYTEVAASTPLAARPLRWRGPDQTQTNQPSPVAADGSYNGGTIWPYQMGMPLKTDPTNYTYRLMVTRNNVNLKLTYPGGVDPYVHHWSGLYESFYPNHAQEFPLFQSNGSYPQNGYNSAASYTRAPGAGGTSNWGAPFTFGGYAPTAYTPIQGGIGEPATALFPPRTAPIGSRIMATTQWTTRRGLHYDLLTFGSNVTVADGDTITLPDGSVYEYFGHGLWVSRSAA